MIRVGRQSYGHPIGIVIEDWGIDVWLIWWWFAIGRAHIAGQPPRPQGGPHSKT